MVSLKSLDIINNSTIKILVVDDNPNNLRFLSNTLTNRGYKVQRAISGQLALNAANVSPPDLILLDIMMPGMDGYEVCKRLKETDKTKEIPVIFLSALTEAPDKVKAFRLGGVDYITKPFQIEELVARIENQLTIQKLQKQLKEQNTLLQQEISDRHHAEAALLERVKIAALEADVGVALAQGQNLQEMLSRCASALFKHLDGAFARLWTLNERENILELQASAGMYTYLNGDHSRIKVGQFKIGLIAQERQPQLTHDILNDPQIHDREWAKREGMVAFAGYPLIVENRLVGVMALFTRHHPTEIILQAMASIANSIAVGIDRFWTEEELRKSEERWQLALQGNNDGIWDWNIQTNEAFISSRNQKILGYEDQEIGNYVHVHDWTSHIHPDDIGWVKAAMQDHLNQKTPYYAVEYRVRCKDNHYKWVLSRGQALWDEQGQPVRMVGSITDISDRKIAEEALRQSEAREREKATQLEQILSELQHTQTQLIHTEKMSSLGQMLAGIAHEINNPVSFIYGNLIHAKTYFRDLLQVIETYQQAYPNPTPMIEKIVEETDLKFVVEDWQKLINSMEVGAKRIHEIVRSLQLFCRQSESDLNTVDIHEAIDNTLLILQHRLKAQNLSACDISSPSVAGCDTVLHPYIEVIKDYGQLPKVTCYASQLNQVFMNLLSNAIDALQTKPCPRVITIHTEVHSESSVLNPQLEEPLHTQRSKLKILSLARRSRKDSSQLIHTKTQNSPSVIIRISDNGTGISEDVCQQIFDPFFTTKPVGSGTGLGLAISYQIVVEKHGGQLSCVSIPGQGTEFIVEIPCTVQPCQIKVDEG